MSEIDIEVEVFKIFSLAYRRGMTVKEFRQSVMEVAREHDSPMIRTAMLQAVLHMSNVRLTEVMESTARAKAELARRMIEMLPDDPEALFK